MANHGMSALYDDRRVIRLAIQRVFCFADMHFGIFPSSGRGIKFTDAPKYIRLTYNLPLSAPLHLPHAEQKL
jgi:hypothetical protein